MEEGNEDGKFLYTQEDYMYIAEKQDMSKKGKKSAMLHNAMKSYNSRRKDDLNDRDLEYNNQMMRATIKDLYDDQRGK